MQTKGILKKARTCIMVTVATACLSGLSLSVIPFVPVFEKGKSNVPAYLIAGVFWGGLIVALVAAHITKKTLRDAREKLIVKGQIKRYQLPGVFSFSGNWRMWIIYGIIVLGLVLIITDIVIGYISETLMFPIVSVTILLFTIHCVVDGKYYKVYKLIKEGVKNETNRKV